MTCKDCIHYNVCNMYDGPYISVHLEHTCENFTDRSEWVHLPSDEYTFNVRGDIAKGLIISNCRAAERSIGNEQNRRV